jgi:hypothetical protein
MEFWDKILTKKKFEPLPTHCPDCGTELFRKMGWCFGICTYCRWINGGFED